MAFPGSDRLSKPGFSFLIPILIFWEWVQADSSPPLTQLDTPRFLFLFLFLFSGVREWTWPSGGADLPTLEVKLLSRLLTPHIYKSDSLFLFLFPHVKRGECVLGLSRPHLHPRSFFLLLLCSQPPHRTVSLPPSLPPFWTWYQIRLVGVCCRVPLVVGNTVLLCFLSLTFFNLFSMRFFFPLFSVN